MTADLEMRLMEEGIAYHIEQGGKLVAKVLAIDLTNGEFWSLTDADEKPLIPADDVYVTPEDAFEAAKEVLGAG